jgi:hypothetical protein
MLEEWIHRSLEDPAFRFEALKAQEAVTRSVANHRHLNSYHSRLAAPVDDGISHSDDKSENLSFNIVSTKGRPFRVLPEASDAWIQSDGNKDVIQSLLQIPSPSFSAQSCPWLGRGAKETGMAVLPLGCEK